MLFTAANLHPRRPFSLISEFIHPHGRCRDHFCVLQNESTAPISRVRIEEKLLRKYILAVRQDRTPPPWRSGIGCSLPHHCLPARRGLPFNTDSRACSRRARPEARSLLSREVGTPTSDDGSDDEYPEERQQTAKRERHPQVESSWHVRTVDLTDPFDGDRQESRDCVRLDRLAIRRAGPGFVHGGGENHRSALRRVPLRVDP